MYRRVGVLFSILLMSSTGFALPKCLTGDMDWDCEVGFGDVWFLGDKWLDPVGSEADIIGNNGVDMADFAAMAENWGNVESPVVINEVHYNPDVKTELVEFIELHNRTPKDVDISGWYFSDGISYQFPPGTTLSASSYIVVAQTPTQVRSKFGVSPSLVFGPWVGSLSNEGERIVLRDRYGEKVDEVDYQLGFPWPTVGDSVPDADPPNGKGHSMQLVFPYIDNDLAGSWRSGYPTPARGNSFFLLNTPPHMRQVNHSPNEPKSGEEVKITVKVTDSDGVASVMLAYQTVDPGSYIQLNDPLYKTKWTWVGMTDDGTGGDEAAGDETYTVVLPGSLQVHRRLVRYRITAMDMAGESITGPYPDDPQPNFAFFVYDGVPAWQGAIQPGVTPVIEFGTNVMRSLPVYHLISKKSDVETSTWLQKYAGDEYNWFGTLVYDGEVYDHIRYRTRGGVWRYSMGKNMWKFDFLRGHSFQARDDYGNKYDTKWDKLNFSACIQQGSFGQRGEQGMFEALSFRLFNMAGSPASKTNWVHFRIIDEAYEDGRFNAAHSPLTSGGTQYDGDFWGLYMTIEQMDGRFLDEHKLPDGNLYKMDSAYPDGCDKNNQGPTAVADKSDVLSFRATYQSSPSADWWGRNVNLDSYYGHYAIYHAVWHGDITSKNHFFYLNPELMTNKWGTNYLWWQFVWDLDLTWTCYYSSVSDPFSNSGVLNYNVINIANRNRVREIHDLLFNPEQTGRLIDEYAAIINDAADGLSMVDADRAMWDYHWVMSDAACSQYRDQCGSNKAGQNRFYKKAESMGYSRSFEGMVQVMKDFVVERQSHMASISSDPDIPYTPTVTYVGAAGFPINGLFFHSTDFADPQGARMPPALKWRIAEVSAASGAEPQEQDNVLVPEEAFWKYFKGRKEPSVAQGAWRQLDFFEDANWVQDDTAIGFGESFLNTTLSDMRYNYSTIYLRKEFTVANVDAFVSLTLEAKYDDGINIWINGHYAGSGNVPSEEMPYTATLSTSSENPNFVVISRPDPGTYLVPGRNIIAVQVINSTSSSGDCFADVRLTGELREEPPVTPPAYRRTPGKYEIEPVWESGELAISNTTIRIPASVVKPGHTYRVRCRMRDDTNRWSHWSEPNQFVAGEPISVGVLQDLRITEVMYNPAGANTSKGELNVDSDEFEFIELKNIGEDVLDLKYVSFVQGVTFNFYGSSVTSLGPGQFVLVVRNKAAFESRYGTGLSGIIAGQYIDYNTKLDNAGETVQLVDTWNGTIALFTYSDGRGWPLPADGSGHSLVPLASALPGEPDGSLDWGGNWRHSAYLGGSPGADDPELPRSVVLNEVMAHTDYSNPAHPEYDSDDWIELYNTGGTGINLSGWYLSDNKNNLKKWAIPSVNIGGGGRISFDEVTGFHNPITTGFGLDKAGEEVLLSFLPGTSADRVVDYVRFKGEENFVSLARYPDGGSYWLHTPPSRDLPNNGGIVDIVVDELMYHPVDANEEYIELYNPTGGRIYLENADGSWRLDGAVDYVFTPGAYINAGDRLIVVGFDPATEWARLNAFISAYGTGPLTAGVDIVGPWSGVLANEGERLALERPQAADLPLEPLSWVVVDEVIYGSVSPWAVEADGLGAALQRNYADRYHSGNDPANWRADWPTPGRNP